MHLMVSAGRLVVVSAWSWLVRPGANAQDEDENQNQNHVNKKQLINWS
jgi:hypothetical protein